MIVPFSDSNRLAFGMDQENRLEAYCVMINRDDDPILAMRKDANIHIVLKPPLLLLAAFQWELLALAKSKHFCQRL